MLFVFEYVCMCFTLVPGRTQLTTPLDFARRHGNNMTIYLTSVLITLPNCIRSIHAIYGNAIHMAVQYLLHQSPLHMLATQTISCECPVELMAGAINVCCMRIPMMYVLQGTGCTVPRSGRRIAQPRCELHVMAGGTLEW